MVQPAARAGCDWGNGTPGGCHEGDVEEAPARWAEAEGRAAGSGGGALDDRERSERTESERTERSNWIQSVEKDR